MSLGGLSVAVVNPFPSRWALVAALLRQLTWPEWRAHAWRQSAAWVAVALGVGLLVTLASAYLPARRAGRVAPVAAMRDDVALAGKDAPPFDPMASKDHDLARNEDAP